VTSFWQSHLGAGCLHLAVVDDPTKQVRKLATAPTSVLPYYYPSSITSVVMNAPNLRLGDLQLRILEILWDRTEASVADVHAVLKPERELAYTTVATMLRKMEARELVGHREEGRTFLYRALVHADAVTRSAGEHFVGRLFEGSLADAVSHLLTTREVSRTELDQIEKMIREAKRRAR